MMQMQWRCCFQAKTNILPDNKTIIPEQKVFLRGTDAPAAPPWPGNPDYK